MRDDKVCQVEFVPPEQATGELARAYQAVASQDGRIDHLYQAMALTPAAIEPSDRLYRALLHNNDCPFDPWLRELISTQSAIVCGCDYAVGHHGENFHDFYGDRAASEALLADVRLDRWHADGREPRLAAILDFNHRLSRWPETVTGEHIEALRSAGLSDKEIVYLAHISALFAYSARVLNGLGTVIGDEPVGLAGKRST